MIYKHFVLKTFLNESKIIYLFIDKCFKVLLCNGNNITPVIHLGTFKWIYIYDL